MIKQNSVVSSAKQRVPTVTKPQIVQANDSPSAETADFYSNAEVTLTSSTSVGADRISGATTNLKKRHSKVATNSTHLRCLRCDMNFNSLKQYNKHKKQHTLLKNLLKPKQKRHKPSIFRTRSRYRNKCKYCDKTFPKPSQCERHERIHTGVKPFKVNLYHAG